MLIGLKIWMVSLLRLSLLGTDFQGATHLMPFDEDTINYSKMSANSVIEKLQKRIDQGEVKFNFDNQWGYLEPLLRELKIIPSSQILTFAKTSLQRERINPNNPRSLYFNDRVYIGYIPGAPVLEVAVADPKLGGVFYTLEQKEVPAPKFARNDQCLECHASAKTMGVPGHLIRSFETDESGVIELSTGTSQVNHRTPLKDRWGGWYVTGTHGNQMHRGNLMGKPAFERQAKEPNFLGNLTDLSPFFETRKFIEPSSDIVALMIFEHQAHMHNFLARLNYEATLALEQYGHLNYLKSKITSFLKYLLFVDEIQLTAPVNGRLDFIKQFSKDAPKDQNGRSLRDLDLKDRMFKYPCSYMIYSEAFDSLPPNLLNLIYSRLYEILTRKDTSKEFEFLTSSDRKAILEILAETKKDLPAYWRASTNQSSSTPQD